VVTFALYEEVGKDGYPPEWHTEIKDAVREQAGHRCVRCHHPYRKGEHGNGEWTPCDDSCRHDVCDGDVRAVTQDGERLPLGSRHWEDAREAWHTREAHWRILTVHHLDGNKANCRWWNLAALCQRCHLTIQGRVVMARVWPWEHSDWFKPYVAGYYASVYRGEELSREEVGERLEELLALERAA
jgi:hypothetical protein